MPAVSICLDEAVLVWITRAKGGVSRSAFVNNILRAEMERTERRKR